MKRIPRLMNKTWFSLLPVLMGIAFAQIAPDETPCGVVMKTGKGVQAIPPHGKVQTHFSLEGPVACGSMLITQQEAFWIRMADQTVVKIGPRSFIEVPKSSSQIFRIHRGSALVSAPPGIYTQTWTTPNAESVFKGGVAYIQYVPSDHVTTVGCFNRNFEFRNKFNGNAVQLVRAGETSHLMIQEAQVTPSQPSVMSHASVEVALAAFSLPAADHAELAAIVKRVYDERTQSLASEIEDWDGTSGKTPTEKTAPSRTIASVKESAHPQAVDPKEANFVAAQLRAHLYGEDSVEKKQISNGRKPASASETAALVDPEDTVKKAKLGQEMKKLEKEIEKIDVSE